VLQALGQAFGALDRLVLEDGRHRTGYREELGLDPRPEASRTTPEQPVQARDGLLKARDWVVLVALARLLEVDDLEDNQDEAGILHVP